jgi:hypothetical protein
MANERHQYESLAPGETGQSRNEKILGAVSFAALAVGGKELWERRDGEEQHPRLGDALSTAAISAAGAFTGYKAGELYAEHTGTGRREVVAAPEIQHAAKAALLAGAIEAFRVRKEPGGWDGPKGRRVLTAAIGAGAIDAAAKHKSHKHSKRHALEAIVGGLAGNRVLNGPRNNIEREWGRKSRSRSRELSDSKSYSSESYQSRSPSPSRGARHDRYRRRKSLADYARNGLAAIGAG